MAQPQIFNIQKFSIHDGDGIRTTIFFKGCPLRCKWCHNPESQRFSPELLFYSERCVGCGACKAVCPHDAINERMEPDRTKCVNCGVCVDACHYTAREMAGKFIPVREVVRIALQDTMFYEESGGGVTLSGGEVMVQDLDYLLDLLKQLKRRGIHVAIDTCGDVPFERFEKVLPYVDVFLYDLKLMDSKKHEYFIGVPNTRILENLKKLDERHAAIQIRIPLIEGVNCDEENIAATLAFLKQIHPVKVNLLPYHNTGKSKYERLQQGYADEEMAVPSKEWMEATRKRFEDEGYQTKIGG